MWRNDHSRSWHDALFDGVLEINREVFRITASEVPDGRESPLQHGLRGGKRLHQFGTRRLGEHKIHAKWVERDVGVAVDEARRNCVAREVDNRYTLGARDRLGDLSDHSIGGENLRPADRRI